MDEDLVEGQDVAAQVRSLLLVRIQSPLFADDAPLGEAGLGLDSIAIVEVLVECEERFGVSVGPLIERGPSVGDLIAYVRAA